MKSEPEARSQHLDTGVGWGEVGVGRCGKKLLERGITLLQIFKHLMAMISEVQKASLQDFMYNTILFLF